MNTLFYNDSIKDFAGSYNMSVKDQKKPPCGQNCFYCVSSVRLIRREALIPKYARYRSSVPSGMRKSALKVFHVLVIRMRITAGSRHIKNITVFGW